MGSQNLWGKDPDQMLHLMCQVFPIRALTLHNRPALVGYLTTFEVLLYSSPGLAPHFPFPPTVDGSFFARSQRPSGPYLAFDCVVLALSCSLSFCRHQWHLAIAIRSHCAIAPVSSLHQMPDTFQVHAFLQYTIPILLQ